jgi:hypothetical protein
MNNTRRRTLASTIIVTLVLVPAVRAQQMADYTGPVFPHDNALNMRIDSLPVHPNSDNYISSIGANTAIHPDFGTSWDNNGTLEPMGIPYNVVGAGQPLLPITFYLYNDESDPGPWPIPSNPFIEGVFDWRSTVDGDRHLLVVDSSSHILYESGNVFGNADGTAWQGGCGAIFDLNSDTLRPDTWTSADAAGLPIFPLLIRYDEVATAMANGGEIPHAIRFTVQNSQKAYVWPARHFASSSTNTNRPPMGLRFRLKASFDTTGFSPRMQVILRTMKKYGMIVADNGGNWFFQGSHDDRWDDQELNSLKSLHGSDFEAVDISPWTSRPGFDGNSGAVPSASGTTAVVARAPQVPGEFTLGQNWPNPFNPSTTIVYQVAGGMRRGGEGEMGGERVRLSVYDLLGREVAVLVNGVQTPGEHRVTFDARSLASGVYLYRLVAGGQSRSRKLVLLR